MNKEPPDNLRSSRKGNAPGQNDVQLIGPVDLAPAAEVPGKPLSQRKIALFLLLGVMLILMAAGGALLLRHMSDRPASTGETVAEKPAPQNNVPPSAPPAPWALSEPGPQPPIPEPAQSHRQKEAAEQQLAEAKYRRFMSRGMAAFERREYRQAHASLLKARALKPDAAEVRDALTQVNIALQKQRMDTLRQQALTAEAAENWTLALQAYQAVLAMDDKIAFAVDGKQRAEVQISLLKQLDFFLKKPQSLQDDRQLDSARQLIRKLEAAPVKDSRIAQGAGQLEALVTLYATPVPVTIQSDGLTSVAVYRVGRLGRFTVHRLHLRPGTYTVVGSRDGYQDVRQEMIVAPGQPSLQITITCKNRV